MVDMAFMGLTSFRRMTIATTLADAGCGGQPASCRPPSRVRALLA